MDFDQKVLAELRRVVNAPEADARSTHTHVFSMMIWHRSRLLEQFLLQRAVDNKIEVQNGVFQGLKMQLPIHAGIALPMIIGTYESELHPYVTTAIQRGYQHVVNIGCGDGYYVIGMARHMPNTQFFGYDINPEAQAGCRQAAVNNGVHERVTVGGLFAGADFANHPAGQTLVICDIEGAEEELLDPTQFSALSGHDIIVELHEVYRAGITERLRQRFSATHTITFINHQPKRANLPVDMHGLTEMDEFLCVYEGRGGPTPWFVMTVK
jgi:SAM-dependent methyltransferase